MIPAVLTRLTVLADPPVRPDRAQARDWAQRELSRAEYRPGQPSLITRLVDWVTAQLDKIPTPDRLGTPFGVAIPVVLVLAVVGYVLWRTGGLHPAARLRTDEVLGDPERTAEEHRAAADAAEAAGDWRTAVLERFRALVRALADRTLVEVGPGRTADELARTAGSRLPELAGDLVAAARAFDEVRYGDRPATREAARAVADLDARAARARPADEPSPVPTVAAPR